MTQYRGTTFPPSIENKMDADKMARRRNDIALLTLSHPIDFRFSYNIALFLIAIFLQLTCYCQGYSIPAWRGPASHGLLSCHHHNSGTIGRQYVIAASSTRCMISRSNSIPDTDPIELGKLAPDLAEVDVRYDRRTSLTYNPTLDRYLPAHSPNRSMSLRDPLPYLKAAFIPESVQPSYYTFIKWRIIQRYISAVVHVFGTQSLLLGLGQKNHNLGLSAALTWVLKDALGKIVRMIWASKMGRKFDPDAKRWRFRSSLLFALGNFLEICAFINPPLFIIYATLSNCLKQMSMLTSSATRNALYNSFKLKNSENIGDITAKGEAQIAIVDLLGIGMGVCLSKFIGISIRKVLLVYFTLQSFEIWAMYKEIRSVTFRVLNFERLIQILDVFVRDEGRAETIFTPEQMAKREKIFWPPNHLQRRGISFGSLGRARLSPEELFALTHIFANEKFLLVVGENAKQSRLSTFFRRQSSNSHRSIQENCHIVLHVEANNIDIVKSTLALVILRKHLAHMEDTQQIMPERSGDCMDVISKVKQETDVLFPESVKVLSKKGWATPARFMFGRVSMRAEWPIVRKRRREVEEERGHEVEVKKTWEMLRQQMDDVKVVNDVTKKEVSSTI